MKLVRQIKSDLTRNLNWMAYSGWTYEELLIKGKEEPEIMALLEELDLLVDGRFELREKDLKLLYRGSRNQRYINLRETRKSKGEVVLAEE